MADRALSHSLFLHDRCRRVYIRVCAIDDNGDDDDDDGGDDDDGSSGDDDDDLLPLPHLARVVCPRDESLIRGNHGTHTRVCTRTRFM